MTITGGPSRGVNPYIKAKGIIQPTMSYADVYHFPPELFQQLVDALPLLTKSKKDLILFFRGQA